MKILILTGSPHPAGTTALLADRYEAGALAGGHQVVRLDAGRMRIHPCVACDACLKTGGVCVFKDDMREIAAHLRDAERVVLVTPLYYFGMSAQLKTMMDRFYAVNDGLTARPREFELLAAGTDTEPWAMEALTAHYYAVGRYLGWHCREPLLAFGCPDRQALEQTAYGEEAYARGQGRG